MQRFLHAQRLVVILMVAAIFAALGIGLWPVQANVFGDASYACGSGFVHSTHDWNVDSQTLRFERLATDTAAGPPAAVCPNKVESRRDLALLVLAFGLAVGLIAQILLERPRARSYRSTLWANRRIVVRPPAPLSRPRSSESSVT